MITVQLKEGHIQTISNTIHYYSSSNHSIGIRTDFPYTLSKLETKVGNLSSIPSIRNNSEIITIQKNPLTMAMNENPILFYKSIVPEVHSNITIGKREKPWNRLHISSNCFFIENKGITVNPLNESIILPGTSALNITNSNMHVVYGASRKWIMPPGVLVPYGGMVNTTVSSELFQPKGYLPCDGRLLSTVQYSRLFSVLGYNYGGSGSSFAVPDFRARSPFGYDTSISIQNFKGGQSNITLAETTTMPFHSHTIQYKNGDNPVAEGDYGLIRRSQKNVFTSVKPFTGGFSNYKWNLTDVPRGGTFLTETSGNSPAESFSVLHPYVLVHFLIKT
jgi:microcystin-dependent protein